MFRGVVWLIFERPVLDIEPPIREPELRIEPISSDDDSSPMEPGRANLVRRSSAFSSRYTAGAVASSWCSYTARYSKLTHNGRADDSRSAGIRAIAGNGSFRDSAAAARLLRAFTP